MAYRGRHGQGKAQLGPLMTKTALRPALVYISLLTMDMVMAGTILDYVRLEPMTWREAYNTCREKGRHIATYDELQSNETLTDDIWDNTTSPIWTWGFEFKSASNNIAVFQSQRVTKTAGTMCFKDILNINSPGNKRPFRNVSEYCTSINSTVVQDLDTESVFLRNFAAGDLNQSFWTENVKIESFLESHLPSGSSTRCIVQDQSGRLSTDDCSVRRSVVCLKGEVQTIFQFRRWSLPKYDPNQDTTTAGSSATSNRISISPSETKHNSSTNHDHTVGQSTIKTDEYRDPGTIWEDTDIMYTFIGVGIALALVFLVVLTCCCLCRGRQRRKPDGPQLSDVYSDALDSISMKQRGGHKDSDYAIPEDAIRKARQRHSIGENEYDTIPETVKKMSMKQQDTPNIYSHVTVGYPPGMYENPGENAYDVSTVATNHKPAIVTISQNDDHQYGHLGNPS